MEGNRLSPVDDVFGETNAVGASYIRQNLGALPDWLM